MKRPWLVPGVLAGACVPAAYLAAAFASGRLGANPAATALNQLGLVGLVLLVASLACTPLRILFGWKAPLQARRMLGLLGFAYLLLHALAYAVLDKALVVRDILEDIVERPFILAGFTALLLLVPLAVTSTPRAMKRLGRSWHRLHRLVYVIVPLGVVHFAMKMKSDITQPAIYGAVVAALLAVRVLASVRARLAARSRMTAPARGVS